MRRGASGRNTLGTNILGTAVEQLETRQLLTAAPYLVADINTQEYTNPINFVEFNDRFFYATEDAEHGRELWSTDGTPAGTHLVADILVGLGSSNPSNFIVSNGELFFFANDGTHGSELWKTDGTSIGTTLVSDIYSGPTGSGSSQVVEMAGKLYFVASTDSVVGTALWTSDGTAAGTELVKAISTAWSNRIFDLTVIGDRLYFRGDDGVHGDELWTSDGTTAGTYLVKDINPGASDALSTIGVTLFELNGEALFYANDGVHGDELWKTDGTEAGTAMLRDIRPGSSASSTSSWNNVLVEFEGAFYFEADDGISGYSLWKTDGTAAGTMLFQRSAGSSSLSPDDLLVYHDALYFTGRTDSGKAGVWKTDGTTVGTTLILETPNGNAGQSLVASGDKLFIAILGREESSLWVFDEISPPVQIPTPDEPFADGLFPPTAFNGKIYFAVGAWEDTKSLWESDGTAGGTHLTLNNVGSGSSGRYHPLYPAVIGDTMVFYPSRYGIGRDLWRIDLTGTPSLLQDITSQRSEDSLPTQFTNLGDKVLFIAQSGAGEHLWATGGSTSPAVQLTYNSGGNSDVIEHMTVVGDLLYFTALDESRLQYLGVTDGTLAGTHRIEWNFSNRSYVPRSFTNVDGQLMFSVTDAEGGGSFLCRVAGDSVEIIKGMPNSLSHSHSDTPGATDGDMFYFLIPNADHMNELWRSDGTPQGTYPLSSVVPQLLTLRSIGMLTAGDGVLYFTSSNQLWKTDGTQAGTLQLVSVNDPKELTPVGDLLYFRDLSGYLWVTNGTVEGTRYLAKLEVPTAGWNESFQLLNVIDNTVYFIGSSKTVLFPFERGLWKTNGTVAGTVRVIEYDTSIRNVQLAALGDTLYYYYDGGSPNGTFGRTDGTLAGTYNLPIQIPPAFLSSTDRLVHYLAQNHGTLFFPSSGDIFDFDPRGIELWAYDLPAQVLDTHLFYNNSKFDGRDSAANAADANAIAPDKSAYLPGSGRSTFDNVSSYALGINGVMIDLKNVGNLSSEDFHFRITSNSSTSSWVDLPDSVTVTQASLDGVYDSDRITLTWPDGSIKNTWLEVTVLANENTHLESPYVFYYGSRIGDSNFGSPTSSVALTNALDEIAVRSNTHSNIAITNLLDFNRDGLINAGDEIIARSNTGVLRHIQIPSIPAALPALADDNRTASSLITAPLASQIQARPTPAAVPFTVAAVPVSDAAVPVSVTTPRSKSPLSWDPGVVFALAIAAAQPDGSWSEEPGINRPALAEPEFDGSAFDGAGDLDEELLDELAGTRLRQLL